MKMKILYVTERCLIQRCNTFLHLNEAKLEFGSIRSTGNFWIKGNFASRRRGQFLKHRMK